MTKPDDPLSDDLFVLYELSLSIGRTLDLNQTCKQFISTLLSRHNIAYASVWIWSEQLDESASPDFARAVHAVPWQRISRVECDRNERMFNLLGEKPFKAITANDPLHKHVMTADDSDASFAFFALSQIGLLKLASDDPDVFTTRRLNQLATVVSKFAVALEGCIAHSRLLTEVAERQRAEQALRESHRRFKDFASIAADWFWEMDANYAYTFVSDDCAVLFDVESADIVNMTHSAFLDELHVDPESRAAQLKVLLEQKPFSGLELTTRRAQVVKTFSLSANPLFDDDGAFAGYRGTGQDITERQRAAEHIHYLAYSDPVTNLPNRVALRETLDQWIGASTAQTAIAVCYLDLDDFKRINDTFGHSAGDRFLRAFANRLLAAVQTAASENSPVTLTARLGGDEFAVLVNDVAGPSQTAAFARRILESMSGSFDLDGQKVFMTPSIGVALYPRDGQDQETLLQHADTAMYSAKIAGKRNVQFFSPSMSAEAKRRLALDSRIREALDREDFFLVYQPQVTLATGKITGVEALVRWRDPELGIVSPAEFIPQAEESGVIVPLGDWVLLTACRTAKHWMDSGVALPRVSVNISVRQFIEDGFVTRVSDILSELTLPASMLELEITESLLAANVPTVFNTLEALNDLGVRLAVDDFGTGYSNLSYLKRFPIDRLKIDRSFVGGLSHDDAGAAIVTSIIAMAKGMRLAVTAEGVETWPQIEFLAQNRCQEVQGFLLSKPVVTEDIPPFVTAHNDSRWAVDFSESVDSGEMLSQAHSSALR